MNRPLALVLGYAADRLLGDPRRFHPVAGFGGLATRLERAGYADRRSHGVRHVVLLVGGAALVGRALDREAAAVESLLLAGRLDDARRRLTHLVGRDTSVLDEAGVARAVIESVAENTSDAVVAALVWGALAGAPGLLAYRAANTLDAMVGHHTERYERFGWAAARLDDVLNVPGARLAAVLAVALGGDPRGALAAWHRDAGAHPSPNAGPVEAAFAGALGVRLGGETVYATRTEQRPVLGDGRAPTAHDITRARALARRVDLAALVVCAGAAARSARRRRR